MQVQVELDFTKLAKALTRIADKNVPFAMARAVTDTAKEIKTTSIHRLNRVFQIRSTWLERGMRVISADWKTVRQEARVGTKDPFMVLQQTGGDKAPLGASQGVPEAGSPLSGGMPMPRGTAGERTTPKGSRWPKHLIEAILAQRAMRKAGKVSRNRAAKNKLVYLENAKTVTIGVRTKFGKGSNTGRDQFKALWFLVKRPVHIPKRWDFLERGEAQAVRILPWYVQKRLDEVIARG